MNATAKFAFLIYIEDGYHLLPPQSMFQDDNLYLATKQPPTKRSPQCDGSILKLIKFSRLGMPDIIQKLYANFPQMPEILPVSDSPIPANVPLKELTYIFYHMQSYLNGERGIGILLWERFKKFWVADSFFPERTPEGSWGTLVTDFDQLRIRGIADPIIIPYLTKKRICPHCLHIRDYSQPLYNPWLFLRKVQGTNQRAIRKKRKELKERYRLFFESAFDTTEQPSHSQRTAQDTKEN